eukprot:SAG31_NODE_4147_length_3531_cov_1.458333_6_plen_224_part_00
MEGDLQLDRLLDELASMPAGLLDDFVHDMPELAAPLEKEAAETTLVGYGALPSGGAVRSVPGPHCVQLPPNPTESAREKPRKRMKIAADAAIGGSGGSGRPSQPEALCQHCWLVAPEIKCTDCATVLCGEGRCFLVFLQLFEEYGTLIERNAALIEKVSPCRVLRHRTPPPGEVQRPPGEDAARGARHGRQGGAKQRSGAADLGAERYGAGQSQEEQRPAFEG